MIRRLLLQRRRIVPRRRPAVTSRAFFCEVSREGISGKQKAIQGADEWPLWVKSSHANRFNAGAALASRLLERSPLQSHYTSFENCWHFCRHVGLLAQRQVSFLKGL
jgi:hypothetical protein